MQLTIVVEIANEATKGHGDLRAIVHSAAEKIPAVPAVNDAGSVRDINGNTVGRWAIGEPGPEHARALTL